MNSKRLGAIVFLAITASPPAHATEPSAPACGDCECASARPEMALVKKLPVRDWVEGFTAPATLHALGDYTGNQPWQFESFSLNMLQPSPTSVVKVDPAARAVVMYDPQPGLKKNPAEPPPWSPAAGAISLTGWVNAKFSDVTVRGVVNSASGPEGAQSRQGLLARWDRHHSYYWFYIDFAKGQLAIGKQQPGTATAVPMPGSELSIPGFKKTAAYRLEFKLLGKKLQGRAFDLKDRLLVETPIIEDAQPHVCGIAGVNAELSLNAPFAPLRASFGELSAVAVAPSNQAIPAAATWLEPYVKVLSRPIETYHYAYRPVIGLPEDGPVATDPRFVEAYLKRKSSRYWDANAPTRAYAMVGGLFAAIDPVISRTFGGIGDSWALFQLSLPRGFRFLDVRGWSDNRGSTQRFPPEVRQRLAQLGCQAEFPSTLLIALETPACRQIALEVARALDLDGLFYRYQGIPFDNCQGRELGSFIVLRTTHVDRMVLMTSESPQAAQDLPDFLRVRDLYARARRAGSMYPVPWPGLEGNPVPSGMEQWMREHLFGCGGYAEDRLPGGEQSNRQGEGR